MFRIQPVWRHFLWWLLLAPVLLVELQILDGWMHYKNLDDPNQTRTVEARITSSRDVTGGYEIRYVFAPTGSQREFSSSDILGRSDLWVKITPAAFQAAHLNGNRIPVTYLADNPWINQVTGSTSSMFYDLFGAWVLFLIIDLVWAGETILIARNFVHCTTAAERREVVRMRFWRTTPEPAHI